MSRSDWPEPLPLAVQAAGRRTAAETPAGLAATPALVAGMAAAYALVAGARLSLSGGGRVRLCQR